MIIMRAIGRGWFYNSNINRMVFDKRLESSCTLSDTERTAKVIADIADSINPSIQVTIDTPERNYDSRLPVLDMKVLMKDNQVVHSFYKKKVASPFTILRMSAIAYSVK